MSESIRKIKVLIVGDGNVHKKKLLLVYSTNTPLQSMGYVPNSIDDYSANVEVDGKTYELLISDTTGQEDYDMLRPLNYGGTDVFLLMFSLVSRQSYIEVREKWYPDVMTHSPSSKCVLVGTKLDKKNDRGYVEGMRSRDEKPITWEEGEQMRKLLKCEKYIECSAKTGENVKYVFDTCLRVAIEHDAQRKSSSGRLQRFASLVGAKFNELKDGYSLLKDDVSLTFKDLRKVGESFAKRLKRRELRCGFKDFEQLRQKDVCFAPVSVVYVFCNEAIKKSMIGLMKEDGRSMHGFYVKTLPGIETDIEVVEYHRVLEYNYHDDIEGSVNIRESERLSSFSIIHSFDNKQNYVLLLPFDATEKISFFLAIGRLYPIIREATKRHRQIRIVLLSLQSKEKPIVVSDIALENVAHNMGVSFVVLDCSAEKPVQSCFVKPVVEILFSTKMQPKEAFLRWLDRWMNSSKHGAIGDTIRKVEANLVQVLEKCCCTGSFAEISERLARVESEFMCSEELQPQTIDLFVEYKHFTQFILDLKWKAKSRRDTLRKGGKFAYEGEWKAGVFHGKGKLFVVDANNRACLIFEGIFEGGLRHGKGVEYDQNSGRKIFSGNFQDGKRHGEGREFVDDGSRDGQWINGEFFLYFRARVAKDIAVRIFDTNITEGFEKAVDALLKEMNAVDALNDTLKVALKVEIMFILVTCFLTRGDNTSACTNAAMEVLSIAFDLLKNIPVDSAGACTTATEVLSIAFDLLKKIPVDSAGAFCLLEQGMEVEMKLDFLFALFLKKELPGSKRKDFSLVKRLGGRVKPPAGGKNVPLFPQSYDGVCSQVFEVMMESLKKQFDQRLALKIIYHYKCNYKQSSQELYQTDVIKTRTLEKEIISETILPHHPHIMQVLHKFVDVVIGLPEKHQKTFEQDVVIKKTGFIVTKLYASNLQEYVKRKRCAGETISEQFIVLVMKGLLSGLCHLHKHKIVHCDMKMDNIFLTTRKNAIIADFGRHIHIDRTDFRIPFFANNVIRGGANFYLAPEVFNVKPGRDSYLDYDKSDVFGGGIILYWLLTGSKEAWGEVSQRERTDENFKFPSCKYSDDLKHLASDMLKCDKKERLSCYKAEKELQKIIEKLRIL